jgi:hypothetical protein
MRANPGKNNARRDVFYVLLKTIVQQNGAKSKTLNLIWVSREETMFANRETAFINTYDSAKVHWEQLL